MKKPLSPRLYLDALKEADPAFIGQHFLRLLEWQIHKGYTVFFNAGWYLRAIHRAWQEEASRRRLAEEQQKVRGKDVPLSTLIHTAMNVLG